MNIVVYNLALLVLLMLFLFHLSKIVLKHLWKYGPKAIFPTSEGEYGDIEMAEKIEPYIVMQELNKTLPCAVNIEKSVLITEKTESAMAAIEAAKYIVFADEKLNKELLQNQFYSFFHLTVYSETILNTNIKDLC